MYNHTEPEEKIDLLIINDQLIPVLHRSYRYLNEDNDRVTEGSYISVEDYNSYRVITRDITRDITRGTQTTSPEVTEGTIYSNVLHLAMITAMNIVTKRYSYPDIT